MSDWRRDLDAHHARTVPPPAQGDLFGVRPTPAYVRGSATSAAAAAGVRDSAETQRGRVLDALREAGRRGLTDEEMQGVCGIEGNAQRPRRRELEKAGLIERSGETRAGRSGRDADVWRVRR